MNGRFDAIEVRLDRLGTEYQMARMKVLESKLADGRA
jgi:hypothetical protein